MIKKWLSLLAIVVILSLSACCAASEGNSTHLERLAELNGETISVASETVANPDNFNVDTITQIRDTLSKIIDSIGLEPTDLNSNSTDVSGDIRTDDGAVLNSVLTSDNLTISSEEDGIHNIRIPYDVISPFVVDDKISIAHINDEGITDAKWIQEVENNDGYVYLEDVPFTGVVITAPVAGFTANVTSGSVPLTVAFTDTTNFTNGNLIDNMSFEAGYPGTSMANGDLSFARSTTQKHNGTYSLAVTATGNSNPVLDMSAFNLSTNSNVYWTVWAYCPSATYINKPTVLENGGSYRVPTGMEWESKMSLSAGTWTLITMSGTTQSDYLGSTRVRYWGAYYANGTADTTKTIYYDDLVLVSPRGWSWNFGDGSSSTSQSPTHTYSTCGAFTTSLNASDSAGGNIASTTITVNPVAGFTGTPLTGTDQLTTTFTDSSTGSPTAWQWNFGDGTANSTSQNPTHTFAPGTYTIMLTASNGSASNTYTRSSYVTVNDTSTAVSISPYVGTAKNPSFENWTVSQTVPDNYTLQASGYNGSFMSNDSVIGSHSLGITGNSAEAYRAEMKNTVSGSTQWTKAGVWVKFINVTTGGVQFDFNNGADNYKNIWYYDITANNTWQYFEFSLTGHAATSSGYILLYSISNMNTGGTILIDAVMPSNATSVSARERNDSNGHFFQNCSYTPPNTNVNLYSTVFNDSLSKYNITSVTATLDGTTKSTWYKGGRVYVDLTGITASAHNLNITATADYTPIANFTSNVTDGSIPFSVQFTDTTLNSPTSWQWNFGDGTANSTSQNPIHIYTTKGLFTVSMTATNAYGSNTYTKTKLIESIGAKTYPVNDQITWSGVTWAVKNGTGDPGANHWSPSMVYTDDDNKMHLWIKNVSGTWQCSEIDSVAQTYGNGVYRWTVQSPTLRVDKNAVLAFFTYYSDTNELDTEASGWGNDPYNKLWWSVQPSGTDGNAHGIIPSTDTANLSQYNISYTMTWETTYVNWTATLENGQMLATWNYTNVAGIPTHVGGADFNAWLYAGAPSDGQPIEFTIYNFSYSATAKTDPTITWNNPAAITYPTALSGTQLNADSGGVAGTFTYTPASGATLGAGTKTLHVDFTPTDSVHYNTASKDVSIVVNKATPSISWSAPAGITYGTALSGTQLNANSGGVSGSFSYNPGSGAILGVGTKTLSCTFNPSDSTNYSSNTGSTSIVVSKATPTISWSNPSGITYGTALSGTQLNANSGGVAGSFSYNPGSGTILGVGTKTLSCTFTPSDSTNYSTNTGSASIVVSKASTSISWSNPSAITYGTSLSGTQLNANSGGVSGSFAYNPGSGTILGAGTKTLQTTFTPTDSANYTSSSSSVSIVVNQLTSVITWSNPSDIEFGTSLSGTQLNAVSNTDGTFVYNPASGTALGIGTYQLHTDFTPTDSTNCTSASKNVTLHVIGSLVGLRITSDINLTNISVGSTVTVNVTSTYPYSELVYIIDGQENNTSGNSFTFVKDKPLVSNVTVYAIGTDGNRSNVLAYYVHPQRVKATKHIESLDVTSYNQLVTDIFDQNVTGIMNDSAQPYVNLMGWNMFWALAWGLPFVFIWLNQKRLTVPATLLMIFGCIIILKMPSQLQTFIPGICVASLAYNLYKLTKSKY